MRLEAYVISENDASWRHETESLSAPPPLPHAPFLPSLLFFLSRKPALIPASLSPENAPENLHARDSTSNKRIPGNNIKRYISRRGKVEIYNIITTCRDAHASKSLSFSLSVRERKVSNSWWN